jgi:hypothetical protein
MSNSSSSSQASTPLSPPPTSGSTNSSGILLEEGINASVITEGEWVNVSLSISNTLPVANRLNSSFGFPFVGAQVDFTAPFTCITPEPAMLVIMPGNYTLDDLRKVANSTSYCPNSPQLPPITFEPDSENATITGANPLTNVPEDPGPYRMAFNWTIPGSLSSSPELFSATGFGDMTPFSPGVYTIAVSDEWGQAVVLHLLVTSGILTGPSSTSVRNPNGGLNLVMSVQPVGAQGNISVNVQEVNPLSSLNNVTSVQNWHYFISGDYEVQGSIQLNPFNPCGPPGPVGLAIFKGFYDKNDFFYGSPLGLIFPQLYLCTTTSGPKVPVYDLFQPLSDRLSVYVGDSFSYNDTASLSLSVAGYWTGLSNPTFHPFPPGAYTIVGGDQWGNIILMYLMVSTTGAISIGTNIVASTSGQ